MLMNQGSFSAHQVLLNLIVQSNIEEKTTLKIHGLDLKIIHKIFCMEKTRGVGQNNHIPNYYHNLEEQRFLLDQIKLLIE